MVRVITEKYVGGGADAGATYIEAAGLSTDTKPTTGIATGSIFLETDTGAVYFYDEEGAQWTEQFSFQG